MSVKRCQIVQIDRAVQQLQSFGNLEPSLGIPYFLNAST
jgi:hypothetical protein